MGTVLKVGAGVIALILLYIWFASYIDRKAEEQVRVESSSLAASPVLAVPTTDAFNETGTIVLDTSHGLPAQPYLLYTTYTEGGKPSVRTKRLVFPYQDACIEKDLPCASNEPGVPLTAEEQVRVEGIVKDDTVEVAELYRVP